MYVSEPTAVLGAACRLRRVLLWFLDDACFLISEAVVSGRRVYPSVQVSFSLRCFSCSFIGEVCEWNQWRNRRGEPALQLHPAGSLHQNHICLSSIYSSWSHFSLHLSGLFVVERLSHAWFCFCCCLHLLTEVKLKTQFTQSTMKLACPCKGHSLNWEAKDRERTDPLNVFTCVKGYIVCRGVVFLSASRLSAMTTTMTAHMIWSDYLRPQWRGWKRHRDLRR